MHCAQRTVQLAELKSPISVNWANTAILKTPQAAYPIEVTPFCVDLRSHSIERTELSSYPYYKTGFPMHTHRSIPTANMSQA